MRYGIPRGTVLRAVEVFGFVQPGGCKRPTDRLYRLTFIDGTPAGYVDSLSGWQLAARGGAS
jgi:hypothetical protein